MTAIAYRSAADINSAMSRVYGHMFAAVLTSMIVSWLVGNNTEIYQFFFTGILKWVVIFAPLAAVIGISMILNSTVSKATALSLLHGFAALMGLSFSTIFVVFNLGSIFSAFMAGAILFGVLSIYGYFTKQNLDSLGQFMFVGLIAIIIASVINIFVGSGIAQMVISSMAIIVFLGLTAYDTQKIREMVSDNSTTDALEIRGALTLYLDFINLFLSLLQIFGIRKED
jgi:FtsH-binding integral membrane protein